MRGGRIAVLPLHGLVGRDDDLRVRSAHALSVREALAVVDMIRGRPLRGEIVLLGGARFAATRQLSPSVRRAIPAAVAAVESACSRLRASSDGMARMEPLRRASASPSR
jgi:hypothetical protein